MPPMNEENVDSLAADNDKADSGTADRPASQFATHIYKEQNLFSKSLGSNVKIETTVAAILHPSNSLIQNGKAFLSRDFFKNPQKVFCHYNRKIVKDKSQAETSPEVLSPATKPAFTHARQSNTRKTNSPIADGPSPVSLAIIIMDPKSPETKQSSDRHNRDLNSKRVNLSSNQLSDFEKDKLNFFNMTCTDINLENILKMKFKSKHKKNAIDQNPSPAGGMFALMGNTLPTDPGRSGQRANKIKLLWKPYHVYLKRKISGHFASLQSAKREYCVPSQCSKAQKTKFMSAKDVFKKKFLKVSLVISDGCGPRVSECSRWWRFLNRRRSSKYQNYFKLIKNQKIFDKGLSSFRTSDIESFSSCDRSSDSLQLQGIKKYPNNTKPNEKDLSNNCIEKKKINFLNNLSSKDSDSLENSTQTNHIETLSSPPYKECMNFSNSAIEKYENSHDCLRLDDLGNSVNTSSEIDGTKCLSSTTYQKITNLCDIISDECFESPNNSIENCMEYNDVGEKEYFQMQFENAKCANSLVSQTRLDCADYPLGTSQHRKDDMFAPKQEYTVYQSSALKDSVNYSNTMQKTEEHLKKRPGKYAEISVGTSSPQKNATSDEAMVRQNSLELPDLKKLEDFNLCSDAQMESKICIEGDLGAGAEPKHYEPLLGNMEVQSSNSFSYNYGEPENYLFDNSVLDEIF